jgi:hypothetical protein
MGYANPMQRITYQFGLVDIGAGTKTYTVQGPKGAVGRLRDIGIAGETLFTNVTTAGAIQVGNATTATKYGNLPLGALAAGANLIASYDAPTALVAAQEIPADTDLQIKFVAPTGGTPAGKGFPTVTIDWY